MPQSNFPSYADDYQVVANELSPEQMRFSATEASASLIIRLRQNIAPPTSLRGIIPDIVGWSNREQGSTGLIRHLPWRHPVFRHLWAVDISRIQFRGGTPNKVINAEDGSHYGQYDSSDNFPTELTVQFSHLPFRVLDEGQHGGKEYNRFTTKIPQPTAEFLDNGRGRLIYAEGPAGVINTPVPQGALVRLAKLELTYTWHQVPHFGLFHDNGRLSTNITDGLGLLNNAQWEGYDAGTLLMLGARVSPRGSAGRPASLGFDQNDTAIQWDVEFHFVHFDPPFDAATNSYPAGAPTGPTQGWNLLPTRHATNLNWYLATRDGNITGPRLYQYYDFDKFFELVAS